MATQKNSISKLIAEIHVPTMAEAAGAQSSVSAFLKEKIIPLIETVANRLTGPGEIIRIDRLELNFENFSPDGMNDAALLKFERQLEEILLKQLAQSGPGQWSPEEATEKLSAEQAAEELFIFIIKEGRLPWWAKTDEPIVLQQLAEIVFENPGAAFKQALLHALRLPNARKRIAFRLSLPLIETLVHFAFSTGAALLKLVAEMETLIRAELALQMQDGQKQQQSFTETLNHLQAEGLVEATALPAKEGRLLTQRFRRFLLEQVLSYTTQPPPVLQFISDFIATHKLTTQQSESAWPAAVLSWLEEVSVNIKKPGKRAAGIQKKESDPKPGHQKTPKNETKTTRQSEENTADSQTAREENEKAALVKKSPHLPEQVMPWEALLSQTAGNENFFVKNAGLVILAPYLSALFQALGFVQNNSFISAVAQQRAVCILQHLATGSATGFEEHDLLLNKVLCGMPLLMPLSLDFEITENEKEECRALLQAIAGHWAALKNTSGEGMRDAFFMRDGLLEEQANGWNLKIEKTTLDILVDKLPWGISIITLPWNDRLLFVNW